MQMLRVIGGLFALLLCTAFAIAFLPNVADMANSARTDPATTEGLTCQASAEGGCQITIPAQHMHPDTSGMTVTITSGGTPPVGTLVITGYVTVGADGVTLTIANGTLSGGATYNFTVTYEVQASNISDATGLGDMLRLFPFFFVIMLLVVGVMVGGMAIGKQLST
jgi:hypothetical protein